MTEQEYSALCVFIDRLLYEIMTLEDYEIVLNRLDIPIRIKNSDRWGLATGCHNTNANEGGTNLSFYVEDRSFYCFSNCQCSYNLLTLVEQRFQTIGKPRKRVNCLRWVCQQIGVPFEFNCEIKHENETIYSWKANLDKYLCKDHKKQELTVYDDDMPKLMAITDDLYIQEWLDDYISKDAQDYYGIRYYKYGQQAVIFVKNILGEVVAVRVRNFADDALCKYDSFRALDSTVLGKKNEKGYVCPTDLIMFGEYQNAFNCQKYKQVYLLESEKGCLQCHDIFGKDKNCALGIMGSNLSDENIKKLISWGIETIYLFADSDYHIADESDPEYIKWMKKMIKLYKKLKNHFNVYIVYNNIGLTDFYKCAPTDKGSDVFWQLWEHKQKIELTDEEIKEWLEKKC